MTQNVMNPSRRSVAKGAAWAVPAVAVAAAAPSLAASTVYCDTVTLDVAAVCPELLGIDTRNLYFTVTNNSDCTVPAGQPLTLDLSGLVGLSADLLNEVNVDAGILFSDVNNAQTTVELAPGESLEIEVFPESLLQADVAGSATLTAPGGTDTASYIITELDLTVTSVIVALCA